MVLHAERGEFLVADALDGVVVQVDVADFHIRGEAGFFDGIVVVLARDFHSASPQVFHRMVAAVMAELEFGNLCAECKTQKLVTEADAHQRDLAQKLLHDCSHLREAVRVGRTVGEENAVRTLRHNLFVGGVDREDRYLHVLFGEIPQDVRLDTEIERDNVQVAFGAELVALRVADLAGVILAVEAFPFLRLLNRVGFAHVGTVHVEVSLLCAVFTQVDGECAGVYARDARLLVGEHVVVQALFADFLAHVVQRVHDNPVQEHVAGFGLFEVRGVCADFCRGEHHELSRVGGVRQNLLVARHAGVEHRFADGIGSLSKGIPVEHGAIRQCQERFLLAFRFPVEFICHILLAV